MLKKSSTPRAISLALRNALPYRLLAATVLAFGAALLTACGGDGSTPPQTISGTVRSSASVAAGPATVCFDADRDLVCGSSERRTQASPQGQFTLELPGELKLSNVRLVAEVPFVSADSAKSTSALASHYVLAGRARQDGVIDALTTLEVLHSHAASETTPDEKSFKNSLRLAPSVGIYDANEAQARRIDAVVQPVLARAVTLLTQQAGLPLSLADATRLAADTVSRVVYRYIEPETGLLLRTVGERTVHTEVQYMLAPEACPSVQVSSVRVDTRDAAPVVSKEDYVAATLYVGDNGDVVTTRVRGRGNSTWGMPKKPYRLKLDKKTELLGMAADKDWALLANYSDKTLMRNGVAMCMSRMLGLAWTPDSRYIELTLNGEYLGTYQLTEHIKTGAHRVDIGEETAVVGDSGMGFLLEIDARLDEVFWFYSPQGVPYTVKSDLIAEQLPTITAFVQQVEAALFRPDFASAEGGYEHYLDTDSLIDLYLINELMRNNDGFWSSTFAYRPRDGKLHFGPVWDFDIAAGNVNYNGNEQTGGWWTRNQSPYVARLLQDPQFERHVKVRWQYLVSRMPELQNYIDATAIGLDATQQRNFQRWPILGPQVWPNAVVTGSYGGEVAYLKDWLQLRTQWMDAQLQPGTGF